MVNKLKIECKAFIKAQEGTLAIFEDTPPAKVQFWALRANDEGISGIGVYDGNLAALDLLPGFAGFR